jgi:hypothetical protein
MRKHQYKLITSSASQIKREQFEEVISQMLEDGWQLAGPLVVHTSEINHQPFLYQGMVKFQ